jgi:Flp pilus assembly protein TadG
VLNRSLRPRPTFTLRCVAAHGVCLGPKQRGAGLVEFALLSVALLLLVLGGLQLALILNAALAVSEYSYAGARYAAVHGGGLTASSYGSTIKANVGPSPTICTSGFSGCPTTGSGLSVPSVTSSDASGKIVSGAQVSVTVTYDLSSGGKLVLPTSFLGFTLPTSITNSTSVMAE